MKFVEKNTLVFFSALWIVFVAFNTWGVSFLANNTYSEEAIGAVLLNSGAVLGGLILTYSVSRFLFQSDSKKAVFASALYMGSPVTLMFGVFPSVPFLEIFFENWIVVASLCLVPYIFWPHFIRSLWQYKPKHKNEGVCIILFLMLVGLCFLSVFVFDASYVFFFLTCTSTISIAVSKVLSSECEANDKDFNIPFYLFIVFLVFVQFFPMVLNVIGGADTLFRIEVDYKKNNGFVMMSLMAVMLSTIMLRYFIKSPLKVQLYSFSVMVALVLSLVAFQVQKHSVSRSYNYVKNQEFPTIFGDRFAMRSDH